MVVSLLTFVFRIQRWRIYNE